MKILIRLICRLGWIAVAGSALAQEPVKIVTPHDSIPNPCNASVYGSAALNTAIASGNWSASTNWSLGRTPLASDVVAIPSGTTITIDNANAVALNLCVHGVVTFRSSSHTKLVTSNAVVFSDGALVIGEATAPISSGVNAELVVRDTALNTSVDPSQFLTGIIVLGKFRAHGEARNFSFIRLASEVAAAQSSLTLAVAPTGWRVGDRVILPGSNQMPEMVNGHKHDTHNFEERTIAGISGTNVTLSSGATYAHPGARDAAGTINFLPHLGNLSRNVIIRSQTLAEAGKSAYCTSADKLTTPSSCATRGHVLFTGRADVDVRYAAFRDLGRTLIITLDSTVFDVSGNPTSIGTNQIGRYPIHAHHLSGPYPTVDPTYQFRFIGNAIDGGTGVHQFKWGVAIHNSHYGLIQDNFVYNMGGAGFMFEDGSESFNVLEGNFVVRTQGLGPRDTGTNATEGTNFYFRGPNNYVRNNVGANAIENLNDVEAAYFMKYNFVYLGTLRIPNFRGADTSVTGQFTARNGNRMAILENIGNEGYGGMQGLTTWWTCSLSGGHEFPCDGNPSVPSGRSVFKDLKLWHFTRYPYYGYPGQNVTFENLVVRGNPAVMPSCCQSFFWGDYAAWNLILKNVDIQGIRAVTLPYWAGGDILIEDSVFTPVVNIKVSQSPGACPGCLLPARRQIFKNVRFIARPGQPIHGIKMIEALDVSTAASYVSPDQTVVCNHNGVAGDSFQLYYLSQDASAILPGDAGQVRGCPGGPMTNQQCRTQYNKSFADEIAPCSSTRPASDDFLGYACRTPLETSICGDGVAPNSPTNFSVLP